MKTVATVLDRPIARSFGVALTFTVLTACLAQAAVRLPFTPVPVTLQVLGVILSGLVLGSRLGALAQLQYLALGLAGAPVFAGAMGGPAVLLGPSGGYLPGFVAGAFLTGWLFERCPRPSIRNGFYAGMVGVAGIYICGAAWLSVWLTLVGTASPAVAAWIMGVLPFIGLDAVKVTLAAMIASSIDNWKK